MLRYPSTSVHRAAQSARSECVVVAEGVRRVCGWTYYGHLPHQITFQNCSESWVCTHKPTISIFLRHAYKNSPTTDKNVERKKLCVTLTYNLNNHFTVLNTSTFQLPKNCYHPSWSSIAWRVHRPTHSEMSASRQWNYYTLGMSLQLRSPQFHTIPGT